MRHARLALITAPLLALVLAGCTAPEGDEQPDLIGTCPAWVVGPASASFSHTLAGNTTQVDALEPPDAMNAHPLDRYEIKVVSLTATDARLEARAFVNQTDQPLPIRSFRAQEYNQVLPYILFANETVEDVRYYVDLVPATQAAAPADIRIEWRATDLDGRASPPSSADVRYEVSYWYRVCGLPQGT